MALTVDLKGQDAVIVHLQSMSDQVRRSLLRAVTAEAIRVQAAVQAKLAGPVLKEVTHRLHDSVHFQVDSWGGGVVAKVGTNVVYAAIHEYGFNGTEQVREHLRHISVAFGKPIAPVDAMVRAHTRHVNMPERSFLRSTLREMAPEIRERLQAAIDEAVRQ